MFRSLRLQYCTNCGFGFALPELSEEKLNLFYEQRYRAKDSTFYFDSTKAPKHSYSSVRGSRHFAQLMLGRAFSEFNKGDNFLDIGSGAGGSFRIAKALFTQPSLHAIEKSEGTKEYNSKYFQAYSHDSLCDFISTGTKARMLLMSHSLEHFRLSDLADLFSEIKASLHESGVIVIEVPNVDLRIHKDIRGADTPHLLFFTKQSLMLLLDKFNFDVLFIDTCGEEYITQSQDRNLMSGSFFLRIKHILKKQFNRLPMNIRNIIRSLNRIIHGPKQYIHVRLRENRIGKLPQQSYGGNRTCLRVVARKNL